MTTPATPAPPLIQVIEIAKRFGATQALRNASFEVRPGEVHALIGENGSGKSTLMKVLAGVHEPARGKVLVGGDPITRPLTPRSSARAGIVTVFQEILVAPARSVLENIWMGADGVFRRHVPTGTKRLRAAESLMSLLGYSVDLDTRIDRLSLSERQACCIARALVRDPKILILDEATSALDVVTRDRLFENVASLTAKGSGVVFITHRMDELNVIGDRVTVMRSGDTVGTLPRGGWEPEELVRLMTGSERFTGTPRRTSVRRVSDQVPVLSTVGLRLSADSEPIDVSIYPGELVGLAGLEGHGQGAFLDALRGERTLAGNVVRHEGSTDITLQSPRHAFRHDVAYVPRERRAALFDWMSILENFAMPTLFAYTRGGLIKTSSMRAALDGYVRRLRITLRHDSDPITTLSGGNQQKVVIARWLAAHPKILLLNDPTRGIDIGAKRDLYGLLAGLAEEGIAVVMLSTEVEEHLELMDRVLVFRESELFREFERDSLSSEALVAAFFGRSTPAEAQ